MHTCDICSRTYTSRASLERHYLNHRKTGQHVCEQCSVVFCRRDLLLRHLKTHEPSSPSSSLNEDRPHGARKRCHTACDACRNRKLKCVRREGNAACEKCIKSNQTCRFSISTNRLSHLAEVSGQRVDPPLISPLTTMSGEQNHGHDFDQQDQLALPSPQRSEHHSAHSGGALHDFSSFSEPSPTQQFDQNVFPMAGGAAQTAMSTNTTALDIIMGGSQGHVHHENNMMMDTSIFDSLSWPWHHELSYLDPGPMYMDDPSAMVIQDEDAPLIISRDSQRVVLDNDDVRPSSSVSHHAVSGEQHRQQKAVGTSTAENGSNERRQVLDEIMDFARYARSDANSSTDHTGFWRTASAKVQEAFNFRPRDGKTLFDHFIELYFLNFDSLWPIFTRQTMVVNSVHPLLYLVLISVGSMYGCSKASYFGSEMHARVQACLVEPLELRDPDYDAPWLAQARCCSRMAALYFGHSRAISHAHHLGTLLAGQARRLELFSDTYTSISMEEFRNSKGTLTDQERLAIWLRAETRRRLAFGIYRSEAYTSLLLQTTPLFYLGEIDLAFPSCDSVWGGEKMPPSVCVYLIENDRTPGRDLYASDLYHIALDREETLPPMDPLGYELLALGLLWPTWKYTRNPTMLSRLCGDEWPASGQVAPTRITKTSATATNSEEIRDYDHLDRPSRKMHSLCSGYKRLLAALGKWEQSLPLAKSFARTQRDRTLLMSGLVVYHLVHLRLSAPANDLHELQYKLLDGRAGTSSSSTDTIARWLRSSRARFAAERALSIWSLIAGEVVKPEQDRAKFNLVAFAGLHDAAVLLWAYASTVGDADGHALVFRPRDSGCSELLVNRENTGKIVEGIGKLLDLLSPGKSASFAQATQGLVKMQFPVASFSGGANYPM